MDQEPASSQPTAAAPMPFSKVVLGLLPLIVLGLGTTLREVPTTSGLARAIIPISFMGPYPVVLIGLLWGWLKGFGVWDLFRSVSLSRIYAGVRHFRHSNVGERVVGLACICSTWNRRSRGAVAQ